MLLDLLLNLRWIIRLGRSNPNDPGVGHIGYLGFFFLLLEGEGEGGRIFSVLGGELGLDVVDEQGIHGWLDGLI